MERNTREKLKYPLKNSDWKVVAFPLNNGRSLLRGAHHSLFSEGVFYMQNVGGCWVINRRPSLLKTYVLGGRVGGFRILVVFPTQISENRRQCGINLIISPRFQCDQMTTLVETTTCQQAAVQKWESCPHVER